MGAQIEAGTYRAGAGEPLVLIHLGASPWHKWEPVLESLTRDFDVLITTLPGWSGGPPLVPSPRLATFVDAIEARMDAVGWDTAHLAGNSLGGWLAFELARRGRARSVVALSPAGGYDERRGRWLGRYFLWNHRLAVVSRPFVALALMIPFVRTLLFKIQIEHPQRLTARQATDLTRDTLLGDIPRIIPPLVSDRVSPYPDLGIPAVVAWAGRDRFTLMRPDGETWRAAAPYADFRIIPDVGHLAMYDDPEAVDALIREYASRA